MTISVARVLGGLVDRGTAPRSLVVVRAWDQLQPGDRLEWSDADGAYSVVSGRCRGWVALAFAVRARLGVFLRAA